MYTSRVAPTADPSRFFTFPPKYIQVCSPDAAPGSRSRDHSISIIKKVRFSLVFNIRSASTPESKSVLHLPRTVLRRSPSTRNVRRLRLRRIPIIRNTPVKQGRSLPEIKTLKVTNKCHSQVLYRPHGQKAFPPWRLPIFLFLAPLTSSFSLRSSSRYSMGMLVALQL